MHTVKVKEKPKKLDLSGLTLNKSFIISILIHLLLILILSISLTNLPSLDAPSPIIVNIEPATQTITAGIEEALQQPATTTSPRLERVTESAVKEPVPDRVTPAQPTPRTQDSTAEIRENLRRLANESEQNLLKQEATPVDKPKTVDTPIPKIAETESEDRQLKEVARGIEQSLDQDLLNALNTGEPRTPGRGDPLSDATWQARPRKTLFFPDLESKIPEEFRRRGMGYSVKVRLAFNQQGLCTMVELIESSGQSRIDSIFLTELRKIRVEPTDEARVDVITATFTISVR
jgi:outer membrane biosynthesis protein TonB